MKGVKVKPKIIIVTSFFNVLATSSPTLRTTTDFTHHLLTSYPGCNNANELHVNIII